MAPSSDPLQSNPESPVLQPEVRASNNRWDRGAWLFRDRTLHSLEILLDEAFRLPGTNFRFGIDGLIGLIPGLGDAIAGVLSFIIPLAAWMRGVPYVTLLRMGFNLTVGILVGAIPFAGDAFDVIWKPNRRNYRLLQLHLQQPRRHTWRDWVFLATMIAGMAFILALPLVLFIWLIWWVSHR